MAVKFKEIKYNLEKSPFTTGELGIIDRVERYIDDKIKKDFDGGSITFPTEVLDFKFNPDNTQQHNWDVWKEIKSTRKSLMTKELKYRFEEAGWKWKLQKGEDDGPNRPAIDYWVLSGNND